MEHFDNLPKDRCAGYAVLVKAEGTELINSQCPQREVLVAGSRDQLCQSRDDVIESCVDAALALPRAHSSLSVCTHGVPVA